MRFVLVIGLFFEVKLHILKGDCVPVFFVSPLCFILVFVSLNVSRTFQEGCLLLVNTKTIVLCCHQRIFTFTFCLPYWFHPSEVKIFADDIFNLFFLVWRYPKDWNNFDCTKKWILLKYNFSHWVDLCHTIWSIWNEFDIIKIFFASFTKKIFNIVEFSGEVLNSYTNVVILSCQLPASTSLL